MTWDSPLYRNIASFRWLYIKIGISAGTPQLDRDLDVKNLIVKLQHDAYNSCMQFLKKVWQRSMFTLYAIYQYILPKVSIELIRDFEKNIPVKVKHNECNSWLVTAFTWQLDLELVPISRRSDKGQCWIWGLFCCGKHP